MVSKGVEEVEREYSKDEVFVDVEKQEELGTFLPFLSHSDVIRNSLTQTAALLSKEINESYY